MIRFARYAAVGVLATALALVAVSTLNGRRFDSETFSRGLDDLLERAARLRAAAGPGYQESVLSALPPNPTIGEFHRLDDELERATVVEEPVPPGDGARPDVVYAFELDDGGAFVADRDELELESRDGLLRVRTTTTRDHLRNAVAIEIPKDDIGQIALRVRARKGKHLRLGWSRQSDVARAWENSFDIPIVADGEFHTYLINARNILRRGLERDDVIRTLVIRPSDVQGDVVDIDFIRFLSTRSRYLREARGTGYETIGAEVRPVLYMLPRQVLEYEIHLPRKEPRFDFGMGIVGSGSEIEFRVDLRDADEEVLLHRRVVSDPSRWRDARLDLSAWADRVVTLRLSVDGEPGSVAVWSSPTISGRPEKELRVVVVLEDTLRADHLSLYGYERSTSPFKERLAAERGVLFLNAFSQATKTRPSVPSMFTSLLPTATGVWTFFDRLSPAYLTLAEVLRAQGFVTATFVQNGNAGPYAGLHQGFDSTFDPETTGERPEELLLGDLLWDWIERHRDRNFFVYLHVTDPHGPYDPPEPYDAWYASTEPDATVEKFDSSIDATWYERPTRAGRQALYDGEIRHNDAVLERFFSRLGEEDLFEDSVFLMTADHGEHFGDHGVWEHRPPGTRQVTGVPLLLVFPGGRPGAGRLQAPVQLLDVMPTVLDLTQTDSSGLVMQGDSLMGLVARKDPEYWRDRIVVSEEPMMLDRARPDRNRGLDVFGSLFYRDWHLIASRSFWPGHGGLPESLRLRFYSLRDDPEERSPLWRYWPDARLRYLYTRAMNRLSTLDQQAWRRFTSEDYDRTIRLDPDALDRLRALGYVE